MKNILCYGDSNTWGYVPGSTNFKLMLAQRFEYGVRWTSLLQQLLGNKYHIIEAGLNGRSTSFDELSASNSTRNGLTTLPVILEMNYPVDLVVLMLGTNDLKMARNASVERIANGIRQLIQYIKSCHLGPNYQAPKILLMCPAPLSFVNLPAFNTFFDNSSIIKSRELSTHYISIAEEENCAFLDIGKIVKISLDDGVHIDRDSQSVLAKAVAEKIQEINLN